MLVDDEMRVRCLLVLADARLDERRAGDRRKAALHECARIGDAGFSRRPITVGRIEGRTARIVADLEATLLVAGYAIPESIAEISPDRQHALVEASIVGWRT